MGRRVEWVQEEKTALELGWVRRDLPGESGGRPHFGESRGLKDRSAGEDTLIYLISSLIRRFRPNFLRNNAQISQFSLQISHHGVQFSRQLHYFPLTLFFFSFPNCENGFTVKYSPPSGKKAGLKPSNGSGGLKPRLKPL